MLFMISLIFLRLPEVTGLNANSKCYWSYTFFLNIARMINIASNSPTIFKKNVSPFIAKTYGDILEAKLVMLTQMYPNVYWP